MSENERGCSTGPMLANKLVQECTAFSLMFYAYSTTTTTDVLFLQSFSNKQIHQVLRVFCTAADYTMALPSFADYNRVSSMKMYIWYISCVRSRNPTLSTVGEIISADTGLNVAGRWLD